MKTILLLTAALTAFASSARTVESFTDGWTFAREGEKTFLSVEIPHDWAIAGPFDPATRGSTGKLPWKGAGEYRKTLVLSERPKGRLILAFDGAMAHATVWANGYVCGRGDYGYLGFEADLTPYLKLGTNNLVVKCDTNGFTSRWYPGGGLYRKVCLVTTDDLFLKSDDLKIVTEEVLSKTVKVTISGSVVSRRPATAAAQVTVRMKDPSGALVATATTSAAVEPYGEATFAVTLDVSSPRLWQLEPNAALYATEVELTAPEASDRLVCRTGFRAFQFDPKRGFILNGARVQLKGVNLHADLGPLGMAFDKDAMRRQLTVMREMGANALRTSHNPPAPEVLDLCDEMGFFVWDECFDAWNDSTGRGAIPLETFVPQQLERFVRRDRNHPCVFVWSIGNEIDVAPGVLAGQDDTYPNLSRMGTSLERCARFRQTVRKFDTTRPVGIGSCFPFAAERGDYDLLDLSGWNYREKYQTIHKRLPDHPVLYSESASALSEFGYYAPTLPTNKTDYAKDDLRLDSYDLNSADHSDIADREFFRMERDTFCAGEFIWTGIDYLGEPTPYLGLKAPLQDSRSSYFGICDLCVLPKDRYYLYRSHWNREAFTLHLVPHHWNFPEKVGKTLPVFVYTSADEAELFVNGQSFGRRRKDLTLTDTGSNDNLLPRYRLIWKDVPYAPGEVKTVAYGADGRVLGEETIRTAGKPVRVVLTPERRYGELCVVQVSLADANGTFVPNDNRRISFAAEGCEIRAVGNSDPRGHDSFKDVSSHPLCFGRAAVYLRIKEGAAAKLTASAIEPCGKKILGEVLFRGENE